MHNSLTSISLEKTIQSSLQLDAEKSKKKRQKLTIESVRQHIESFGYRLLSTQYVSVSTKLEIVCPNQHRYLASYNSFQQGKRCPECAGVKKIHTLESVRQHIESFQGYQLLSTVYVNVMSKLDITCPKFHLYSVSYSKFQQGRRCPECAGVKINKQAGQKHTIETVNQFIESFGYRLLSTVYVNVMSKLDIVCPVGHGYSVNYISFKGGNRCLECDDISKRRTMLNGEEWNPYLRKSKADAAWRKAVLKRDGQACQACHSSKNLCAHHIESFARNPDLQTDISNGVALCEPCHRELHSQYGLVTATRADLAEFTRLKCR